MAKSMHPWAANQIVRAAHADCLLLQTRKAPTHVLKTIAAAPSLLRGIGRETQLAMYKELASRGYREELATIAARKETPAGARSILADVVLQGIGTMVTA